MKYSKPESGSNIGKTIKILRQRKGWTQGYVSAKLSISVAAFSKIEAGITIVNLGRLTEIANILEVTLQSIVSTDKGTSDTTNEEKINDLKLEIASKEREFMRLQQTAIFLYEELKQIRLRRIKNAS